MRETMTEDHMATEEERKAVSSRLFRASAVVIVLTFGLFAAALLVKGLTHDLFLETGVLLVSVKLILNTYHMEEHTNRLEERINDVLSLVRTLAHEHQGHAGSPEQGSQFTQPRP